MTLPVLVKVFETGRGEDEEERKDGNLLVKGVDGGNPVEDDDEEKVYVRHPVELFKEVFREEGEGSVFGSGYLVASILARVTTAHNHNPITLPGHSFAPRILYVMTVENGPTWVLLIKWSLVFLNL